MPKPKKCDYVSYHPFKSHHTSWCFLFLRSWKRCWHNVMSGSKAVYTDPPRTLGITPVDRLDSQLWSGAKAKLRPLVGEWPQVWRFMEQVTLAVWVSKATSSALKEALHHSEGTAGLWAWTPAGAWGCLPPPVPSIPPHPSLPCLGTWLFIHHPENTHRAPVMCHCSQYWWHGKVQDTGLL